MKRKYKFYGQECYDYNYITYDFPVPFIENLDNYLRDLYGSNLMFVKEINHELRVIRLHTAYDSGKGCKYIPQNVKISARDKIKKILEGDLPSNILILDYDDGQEIMLIALSDNHITIFTEAYISETSMGGYKTVLSCNKGQRLKHIMDFIKLKKIKIQSVYVYEN